MGSLPRYARQYVLLDPDDCDPPHGLDLEPGGHDDVKVRWLEEMFRREGFSPKAPALVGYPKDGRIQLLSGTHRHLAAKRAKVALPVRIQLRSIVEATWGTDRWLETIRDIAVEDLEHGLVQEGGKPPNLEDRVVMEWLSYR